MRFPERSRTGDPVHTSAVDRLDLARIEQRQLAADAQAASGTSSEDKAAVRLSAANAEVNAREAWVGWIERGV
jgi:hypothetical protein